MSLSAQKLNVLKLGHGKHSNVEQMLLLNHITNVDVMIVLIIINTLERPRTQDHTECKHAIRHLSETNNPQIDAFDYSSSFTFFDDVQKRYS